MQSSFPTASLLIPDEGGNGDNHEQNHKKLKGIIDKGDLEQIDSSEYFENAIVVE